ncbi:MAG: thioredoxin domain-containing protein [Aeromicrobium sp.]|uniref:DsbA family protein n=1 Tax=Aeromicrobium sp. TaxID=1871063 RepID=UPI0039E55D70
MSNKDRQQRAARAEQMRKEREKAARRQRNLITAVIVVIVAALIGLAAWGVSSSTKENKPKAWSVTYTPEDAGGTVAEGYEPVVVELYEDFQCPACQSLETLYGEQLEALVASGDITLKYHPYSFLDDRGGSTNEYSRRSTNAAICIYEEYGAAAYVQFHDYLYANQPAEGTAGPEDAELVSAAESLGFTGIADCVTEHTYFKRVERAKEAGVERGVSATPTIYVDGKQVEDKATLLDQINALVAERKGTEVPATTDPAAVVPAG